jgi:hypothetical protein
MLPAHKPPQKPSYKSALKNLCGRQLQLPCMASAIFPVESRDFSLATSAVLKNGRHKMSERPLRNVYLLAFWAPLLSFQRILGLTFTKTLLPGHCSFIGR